MQLTNTYLQVRHLCAPGKHDMYLSANMAPTSQAPAWDSCYAFPVPVTPAPKDPHDRVPVLARHDLEHRQQRPAEGVEGAPRHRAAPHRRQVLAAHAAAAAATAAIGGGVTAVAAATAVAAKATVIAKLLREAKRVCSRWALWHTPQRAMPSR